MNITHIAWLGHQNYGDDIMTEAIRKYFIDLEKDINYHIWCENKPTVSKNIKWIYPYNTQSKFLSNFFEKRILKKTDVLLIGGGSILHSDNSIAWKQKGVDFLKKNNPKAKAKAIGINLSLGPFEAEKSKEICLHFLSSLDSASFRDEQSYNFVKENFLPYEPIKSFDLAGNYLKLFNIDKKDCVAKISCIGISLKNDGIFEKDLELIKKISDKYEKIMLFSFCASKVFGDFEYIEKIFNNVKNNNIEIVNYDGNTLKFTKKIRECDFFISTRLHGLIVSFLLNIPFISLSYHQKCLDFLKYVKISDRYIFDYKDYIVDDLIDKIEVYKLPKQDSYYSLANDNFKVFNVIK